MKKKTYCGGLQPSPIPKKPAKAKGQKTENKGTKKK